MQQARAYAGGMPRSGGDAAPSEYIARGRWPDGDLEPGAPASAVYLQVFVRRLRLALEAVGSPSLREVERRARVNRNTVDRVLNGEVLPDFGAVARLEEWLQTDLWPGPEIRAGRDRHAEEERVLDQG